MDLWSALAAANRERQQEWTNSHKLDVMFRVVGCAGETGEILEQIGQLYGWDAKFSDISDIATEKGFTLETVRPLLHECADVLIYLEMVAHDHEWAIDPSDANRIEDAHLAQVALHVCRMAEAVKKVYRLELGVTGNASALPLERAFARNKINILAAFLCNLIMAHGAHPWQIVAEKFNIISERFDLSTKMELPSRLQS